MGMEIQNTGGLLAIIFAASASLFAAEEPIDFNRDIRPLLSNRCVACHGPDEEERKADLRLDTFEGATADLGGYAALEPGDLKASELLYRITTEDRTEVMPPPSKGERFSPAEVKLIRRWIEQGGEYAKHWSYAKPVRSSLPGNSSNKWSSHPVDQFILEKLDEKSWTPSPRADRFALARRIAIDLTGLPPEWSEVEGFVQDESPDAIGKYIDRQLAKASYGERWGRVWLDLARYADSAGYADDPPRTIWAYRDYVIRSFNENKPFDQFTIEQIAGDLLDNPTPDQMIATAFHRNTLTNNEGGTNDEEFRNVAIVDRVNTTMSVWMGTTMACAQCHTHKYDPLTHLEYFQIFDFFNQSADADRRDEAPIFEVWTDELKVKKVQIEKEIAETRKTLSTSTPSIDREREAWLKRWTGDYEWSHGSPIALKGKNTEFETGDDGWIAASSEEKTGQYSLSFDLSKLSSGALTGVRLEVSPEQKGNFVLSQVNAKFRASSEKRGVSGRFVRVELPGKTKTLQIAEVEVFSGGKNVALKRAVTQSSVYASATGANAVDGNTNGDYEVGSVFHSMHQDNPWIEIDLGEEQVLERIVVWNRTDGGDPIAKRIEGYQVKVLDSKKQEVLVEKPGGIPSPSKEILLTGDRNLSFSFAGASYEQKGFPASSTVTGNLDPKTGWAIAGETGESQELLLVLDQPLAEKSGTLELVLDQSSKFEDHLLHHFRLSFTDEKVISEWARIPDPLRRLVARKETLSEKEKEDLARKFLEVASSLNDERKQLASLEKQLKAVRPLTTVPVMADLPEDKRRETHIHQRGSYMSLGEKAIAGVPAVFHNLPSDVPVNRLALAQWLVDDENPLTPRVIANRIWEQLFGIGIVETSEEFGSQGTLPSHPELLDWLAVELRENGWDRKKLLKLIMTSEAYLQDSKVTPRSMEEDPYNRYLARGPRFRISAEMVRDQALAVAGMLSEKRHGQPVNPPQPQLGLKAAFGSKTDWDTSKGEDRYRRGIYTTWRRSSPYPSMATFDAPNREVCTVRRSRTNTPLQALVTLNDPVYVEAAQAWGRAAASGEGDVRARIRDQFRRTLIREPSEGEVSRLVMLYEEAMAHYSPIPDEAKKMAEEPIGPLPESHWEIPETTQEASGEKPTAVDPAVRAEQELKRRQEVYAKFAAWSIVGNVVLNLDEMLLKR